MFDNVYDEDGEYKTRCFLQLMYSSFWTSSNTDYNDYTCLIQTKCNLQPASVLVTLCVPSMLSIPSKASYAMQTIIFFLFSCLPTIICMKRTSILWRNIFFSWSFIFIRCSMFRLFYSILCCFRTSSSSSKIILIFY